MFNDGNVQPGSLRSLLRYVLSGFCDIPIKEPKAGQRGSAETRPEAIESRNSFEPPVTTATRPVRSNNFSPVMLAYSTVGCE